MNLNKLYLTKNECYLSGKTISPKGIMVHSTGANNPNLKRYVGPDDGKLGKNEAGNYWNTARPDGRQVCPHAFIGKLANGYIATYQVLPWTMVGWHAGGAANQTHIGFEICEDDLTNEMYFRAIFNEAVALCVYLCKQFNLTEKNIICHSEGCKLGIASNHSDVMHWFPKHGETMDSFRAAVKTGLAVKNTGTAKQAAGFKPYRVRVTISNLNIRTGPGTNHPTSSKYTGAGVFTIAEEAKGTGASKWGLLASYKNKRNGWISLDYATKL